MTDIDKEYRKFIDSIRYTKECDLALLNPDNPFGSKFAYESWLHLMGLMETLDVIKK